MSESSESEAGMQTHGMPRSSLRWVTHQLVPPLPGTPGMETPGSGVRSMMARPLLPEGVGVLG